ncbi:ABC transporter substrate-binding protein [Alicyclobacillus shizuokensis]|uniref:ABC transporter substrate-binding protein n=1 Tax=Alicyclobacillus shizuokensis TaxID=392014 RepID=UPI00082DAC67|nr:extracellular solute-binding protein [Alicyclobacillus shizuokensis]MCL6626430.1 extracellular solute-binding protein [Alicyclobacillus shizuokensis]
MRRVLAASSVVAVALAVTACGSASSNNTSSNASGNTANRVSNGGAKQVEIFSWWTGAGESDGLKALIKLFKKDYPGYTVINSAVAGGAGSNAKAVLANRMQNNNPPDTFQVHVGQELLSWVDAGKMEPLDSLYQQEGWNSKFPKQLIDMVSHDGHKYAVPVDVHRGNVLWYNKKIFDKYHLTPPKTWNDVIQDAKVLKQHNITPLALGDKDQWETTMLWEDILLGQLGAQDYDKLWQGQISFDDPRVKQSLQTLKALMSDVNSDHAAKVWQDASQMVAKGTAAMNVMGDWAKGYFTSDLHLKPNVDFGWTTTPGTEHDFMVIVDCFGLPKGVKHPEGTKDWLKVLGSVPGQDVFNPLKGSIPARIDADKSKYDVYSQQAMTDFKKDQLTPSLAHGAAASPGFLDAANKAINQFVNTGDIDTCIQQLQSAFQQNPPV